VFIDGKFSNEGILGGKFTKLQFSNGAKYHNSGFLKFSGDYASINERTVEHSTALSASTKRTNDVSEYTKFCELYKIHGKAILEENTRPEMIKLKNELEKNKQRQLFEIVNVLVAHAEALRGTKTGVPLIVAGNPTFSPNVKGKRSVAPKSLLRWLSKFFTVLVVDEYNTSKVKHRCSEILNFLELPNVLSTS
jgi:hypothetical protein